MPEQNIPNDWKDRLLRILSHEAITQPPHRWGYLSLSVGIVKFVILGFLVGATWILSMGGIALLELLISGEIWGETPVWLSLPLTGLFFTWFLAWCSRMQLDVRGDFLGRRPTYNIMRAKHPPVLYLRSFDLDGVLRRPITMASGPSIPVDIESDLVECISRHTCTLAIGRPGEVAAPAGAARFYVPGAMWQTTVTALAPLCQLVVLTTGRTEGLHWEIKYLVENLPPKRLLLWVHVHLMGWTPEQKQIEWQHFLTSCHGVFPKPLPIDVSKVSFLAFNDDWTPESIPIPDIGKLIRERRVIPFSNLTPFLKDRLN